MTIRQGLPHHNTRGTGQLDSALAVNWWRERGHWIAGHSGGEPTWAVSSRVGVTTTAWQPSDRLMRGCWEPSCCTSGARYARVLPVPVGARMSTSRPFSSSGMTACCTAVGVAYFSFWRCVHKSCTAPIH